MILAFKNEINSTYNGNQQSFLNEQFEKLQKTQKKLSDLKSKINCQNLGMRNTFEKLSPEQQSGVLTSCLNTIKVQEGEVDSFFQMFK